MSDVEPHLGRLPDRADKALAFVDRGGKGLEIGPAHRPLAAKRDGFDVQIVDHLSTEELRAKYAPHGLDVDAFEEVDFVWHGEPFADLIGAEHAYDWIIASHVLEHMPDPISFLLGCERVLRPSGVLSLVLPDKRYSFDHYRPLSTTGGLLDALYEKRVRPTPGNVVDHISSAVHRSGDIAWLPGDDRPLAVVHSVEDIRNVWAEASETDHYMDVHVWTFVPESFHLIVKNLWTLGVTTLGIAGEFRGKDEFFVSLTPGHPILTPAAPDRLAALAAAQEVPDLASHEPISPDSVLEPASAAKAPEAVVDASVDSPTSTTMQVSTREQALLTGKRQLMSAVRTLAGAVSASRRPRPS